MKWFAKLKQGLAKSSSNLSNELTKIFTYKKLDQEMLDALEDTLISADLGIETSSTLISLLKKEKFDKDISEQEIKEFLANQITQILKPVAIPLHITHKPHVIILCGVNGNGKTTTIGKLALKYKNEGKTVIIGACDTFRAAAVEQLEIWAERAQCLLIKGKDKQDPSSVAYQAIDSAIKDNIDIVLIDTAGRLHNQQYLMNELEKCIRVIKKLDIQFPHNTILILDSTTGQNALSQVDAFSKILNINGLIITKLDGSAKGGIVIALAKQYKLPIHAIGVGEGIEDLNSFAPEEFAKAICDSTN